MKMVTGINKVTLNPFILSILTFSVASFGKQVHNSACFICTFMVMQAVRKGGYSKSLMVFICILLNIKSDLVSVSGLNRFV